MKYLIALITLTLGLLLGPTTLRAQNSELGINAGVSYYTGDLNPMGHFKPLKFAGGLHYKLNMNKRVSLRASALYARVEASDENALNINQINRNLHFKSNIIEVGGIVEVNFFNYVIGEFKRYKPYSPYLFFGMTYFKMNPKGSYNDEYIELQPLGTEGQGTSASQDKRYNLNQIAIPFGLGFKFNITRKMAMAFEYGVRKTFTDYLDDVSGSYVDPFILASENGPVAAEMADQSINQEGLQGTNTGMDRGNPYTKDWYFYSGGTLSFILGKEDKCRQNFGRKRFN